MVVGERLGKDATYHLDSKKIRQELNWQDHIALDQGLDECIAWAKTHFASLKSQPFDYQHQA